MSGKTQDISGYMKAGVPVLTVNTRLSRHLHGRYDLKMQAEGHNAWPTPLIMPLSSWIETLSNESRPDKPILSEHRSKALWDRIVSSDKALLENGILLPRGVAKTAYDAYRIIREYCIPLNQDDIYLTEEARALKRWVRMYEEEVKRLGFIERNALPDEAARLIKDGKIAVPEEVVLAGFDELTPQSVMLVEEIKKAGGSVVSWPFEPSEADIPMEPPPVNIRVYADEAEEVVQAARWARQTLTAGMRIGIIVPGLERYRKIINREFAAELNPASVLPWEDRPAIFNISLGAALNEVPLIKSALDILALDDARQDINKVSSILLSPYFSAGEEEYLSLARLDADIRQKKFLTAGLCDIRSLIKYLPNFSGLDRRLELWLKLLKEGKERKPPGGWADHFNSLLRGLGWPSNLNTLNSDEYQALKAWNDLLRNLASLDDIIGTVSRAGAVSRLFRTAMDTVHQPESPESPLQVLGILEAAGLSFDHIWILGAHEDAIPGQASPNPFIPPDIQRRFNLPHSSAERELEFAKRVMRRVLKSAARFEVSFPARSDEKAMRLSPLFTSIGEAAGSRIISSHRMKDRLRSVTLLDLFPAAETIPVSGDELKNIRGGASILRDQSACPFKAFALHRLRVSDVSEPELGLSAEERGNIVHDALRSFWSEARDLNKLKEIAVSRQLDGYVKASVDKAMGSYRASERLPVKYLDLERGRVCALLMEWLDIEMKRADFSVRDMEYSRGIDIEGLSISARFDRIDRLNDGREIIIDYKTGECSRYDWLSGRPREPQLLLYNLSGDYDAISFARVKPGKCGFVGISGEEGILPDVRALKNDPGFIEAAGVNDWKELMDIWETTVRSLTRQFLAGDIVADPNEELKRQEPPCTYCDLMILCRASEAEYEDEGGRNGNDRQG